MQTKNVRIGVDAEKIALIYGSSVSKGIVEMERIIQKFNTGQAYRDLLLHPIDKSPERFSSDCCSTVCTPTEKWLAKSQVAPDGGLRMCDVSENGFWKRMKSELDTTIQSYAGRT